MKKKQNSFIKTCVFYLSIYSIILILTFLFINTIIERSIKNIYFDIDSIKEYKTYLKNDQYNNIPIQKYLRNDIVVFNEKNKVIYETHNYEKLYLNPKEFDFIDDMSSDSYFMVQKVDDNNEPKYIISKNYFKNENEASEEEKVEYAIIDHNYKIIEGDLFNNKKKLSKEEFKLLRYGGKGKSFISKYVFYNKDNKKRTLVFYQKNLSTKSYIKIANRIKIKWLIIIPIVLVEIFIIIFLFYRKIKKSIDYTNKKILNPKIGEENDIPVEFNEFYVKITQLINDLNLEKSRREEEEKTKQNIITSLSHDIKTPLTVIQGYAKAFDDKIVPKEKENQYMKAIYEKSILATEIVNSLFQYTKMEHADFKPKYENADFTEFCREYLAIKYSEIELLNYKIEYKLDERKNMFNFDKMLVTRLFDNIISNSIKYNKKGIKIYFNYKFTKDNIIIDIADNGIGIKMDNPNKLFEPFIVGNESRTKGLGTGLGLYIAKQIVDLHNGDILIKEHPKSPYKFHIQIRFKR